MPSVNIDAVRRFVDNDREGHGLLLEGNLGQGIVSFGKGRSSPPIIRQACDHAADEKQSVVRGNSADKVASALGRTPKSALKTLRRSSPQIANAKSSAGLVTAGPAMELRPEKMWFPVSHLIVFLTLPLVAVLANSPRRSARPSAPGVGRACSAIVPCLPSSGRRPAQRMRRSSGPKTRRIRIHPPAVPTHIHSDKTPGLRQMVRSYSL